MREPRNCARRSPLPRSPPRRPGGPTTPRPSPRSSASFTKAFNAGDAAAAAATYAEDALVVDEQGERTEGRTAIRDQLAASFAGNPGATIAIKVDALRFLGPDTALEEGRTTITPAGAGGVPEVTRFTVVYVKRTAAGSSPPSATRRSRTSPRTIA